MDEPTVSVHRRRGGNGCSRRCAGCGTGTTIVYVSHFLEEVLELVDTVTVLRDGEARADRARHRGDARPLVTAMLGRTIEADVPGEAPARPTTHPSCSRSAACRRPPAIENVSFDVRAGEILGLAGLIGSGRSEVARAIFGADRRDQAARSEVAGKALRIRTPRGADPRRGS